MNNENTTSVADWFDITNVDHLKAYQYLQTTGHWPDGFIPKNVTCYGMWQIILTGKMSAAYVVEKLAEAEREANTERYDLTDPAQCEVAMGRVFEVIGLKSH